VPGGGTTGQVLTKQSVADYDTAWQAAAAGAPPAKSFRGFRLGGWTAGSGVLAMDNISWDTENAYNTTTGLYTVPVAGKWRVTFQAPAQSTAAGDFVQAQIRLNGANVSRNQFYASAASQNIYNGIIDSIACNAGDTLAGATGATAGMNGLVGSLATHLTVDYIGP
jgi:hypothetical protein